MPSISFDPALPCSSIHGEKICGNPATVGTLYMIAGGQYILQPFCRECVKRLQAIYNPPVEER
jgi:hypothetical protein